MIVRDIHARLTAVLGNAVPVLLPEQIREPLEAAPLDAQGRPMVGGGENEDGQWGECERANRAWRRGRCPQSEGYSRRDVRVRRPSP